MALLKKIRSSTLMETLVATVLIVIVFMTASMLLNSVFLNNARNHSRALKEHMHLLQYQWRHGSLPENYWEEWHDWEISVSSRAEDTGPTWILTARNTISNAEVKQKLPYVAQIENNGFYTQ